ncbi:M20 family metallo-hydrolase [Desulfotalea psychrophila]|uniref:Related to metal-dependent aminohydrolases n=1 Tax=Desulfotalea psychrophila (strain LSv54 / DSM 12343) TaxID=177439 RepID=Q6AJ94_DESPS|nr:M20 family metallo-hydrolase [Desulfotalea psychrophila]CAG37586.1 related to metal-dependent aminohydrolases [Desulfotalea psychrophila LSv54]
MSEKIHRILEELESRLVEFGRKLHNHAESGWTEFWATAFIADILIEAGYHVKMGREVLDADFRMGLPDDEALHAAAERAIAQGANPDLVEKMRGGFTGLVADLKAGPAARIALRFDIDSNTLQECEEVGHRPFDEGFSSRNNGSCHACGHDGNATIGLGIALALAQLRESVSQNIRLIFQPAEEGVRGALPMVRAGVVDGIKALVGCHMGFKAFHTGGLILGAGKFLATSKFDAHFTGVSSHAGAYPEEGQNSLLAAATASLNMHAIPRHSGGATRITVGRMEAGEGRNIIPAQATLVSETRGETTELNDFMLEKAKKVIKHSAGMYDQAWQIKMMGGCKSGESDAEMIALLRQSAEKVSFFQSELIEDYVEFGGSDDVTEFMAAVQEQGGIASYCLAGTELVAGHHNYRFDFNEATLAPAAEFLTNAVFAMCELDL